MSLNLFWFLPTHGDGHYLGTEEGSRPVDHGYLQQIAQAADRIGQVLGSVAFQLPHSQELEEQYLEGTLLNDLSMKDSKAFRREIDKICKEVF